MPGLPRFVRDEQVEFVTVWDGNCRCEDCQRGTTTKPAPPLCAPRFLNGLSIPERVLKAIREQPSLSMRELAARLELSSTSTRDALRGWTRCGLIAAAKKPIGGCGGRRWVYVYRAVSR